MRHNTVMSTHPRQPGLSEQVAQCAQCVRAVAQGQSLATVMPQVPAGLRPGVQALTFRVMRQWGIARAVVALLAPRKPDPATAALLQTGVVLLLDALAAEDGVPLEPSTPRYAVHTVVDQVVEAAKSSRSLRSKAGFINGCLRSLMREARDFREKALQGTHNRTEARFNHQSWWVDRLKKDHPEDWERVLEADLRSAPMTIRVNRRQHSREAYQAALLDQGLESVPFGDDGLVLTHAVPVDRLPHFRSGACSVQDAAAQLAAPLLLNGLPVQDRPLRVLDACAAPGGKTAHLLELADLSLLALDVDPARCDRIGENLERLSLKADIRAADAARPDSWWDGQLFDAILLDAPCSASGIARRHPDVLWLRRGADIAALAAIQTQLLDTLWPLLRPGGRMVYATCSVFRMEGEDQARAFLERHNDARRIPAPGHLLPGKASDQGLMNDNSQSVYDGFFYAGFEKRSDGAALA